jgi:hypothetical protein
LFAFQEMYGLRQKRLTHKKDVVSGGSNQTGCSPAGIQPKRVTVINSKRKGANDSTERCDTAAAGSIERGGAAIGSTGMGGGAIGSTERGSAAFGSVERGSAAASGTAGRGPIAAVGSDETSNAVVAENTETINDVKSKNTVAVAVDGNSEKRVAATGNTENSLNIGSKRGSQAPTKRGIAKMARTELEVPPRSGRVVLEPVGHR